MWHKWRQERIIRKWRSALNLEQQAAVFHRLYDPVNGFSLSKEARKHSDSMEFVYGEIDFESFLALLSLCQPDEQTVFYDLGSGTGKAVVACALVYPVKKCHGIELLGPLHDCAIKIQQELLGLPGYQDRATKIHFCQGNIFQTSLPDASLIYVNATAFFGESWEQLSRHLEQIQPKSLVISTSKALVSASFDVQKITRVQMSWGVVNAFIQQRL